MNHVGWLQPPPKMDLTALLSKRPELQTWLRKWGSLPTPWRMHFLRPDMLIQKQQSAPGLRARKLMRLNDKLRRSIDQQDVKKYTALLSLRSPIWYSEVVIPAIRGIVGKEPVRLVAGLPNDERMPGFDRQVQIECWAGLHLDEIFPEPLPNSPRCQEDLTAFGRTRALAFEVLHSGESGALSRYVDADPFARPVIEHHDWQKRLGFDARPIV
jgi:hypothetical protein